MKKLTFYTLCSFLLIVSFNATAAATLNWVSTKVNGSSAIISDAQVSPSILTGTGIITGSTAFSHDWEFIINSTAQVSSLSVSFLDSLFENATVYLDSNPLSSIVVGLQRHWSFDQILTGNPDTHTITFSADSASTGAIYNLAVEADDPVALIHNPIPASVWLFGSALLGVSGLSSRRKKP